VAWRAPACEEIEQHHFPFVMLDHGLNGFVVDRRKIGGRLRVDTRLTQDQNNQSSQRGKTQLQNAAVKQSEVRGHGVGS
jgi:hypothetical protein